MSVVVVAVAVASAQQNVVGIYFTRNPDKLERLVERFGAGSSTAH